MDIATLFGLLLGVGLILASIAMGGGGLGPFINIPSLMIVVGGAFSALLINFPMKNVIGMIGVVKNCFLTKISSSADVIGKFEELAAIARKDGLLAIESSLEAIDDDFMRRGLEMVVGGSEKSEVQNILETEIGYIAGRHTSGKQIVDTLGAAAPAFGMIGTLIGLVQMLGTLDDPSKIGGGMATALLTTLYGAVVANLFCIPFAGKLEQRNNQEMMIRELTMMGVLALLDGQTPRVVQERLVAFLPPRERQSQVEKKAA